MKNLIIKPNKENLTSYVTLGVIFIIISFFDVLLNTFIDFNLTNFLPNRLSYFAPLIFGVLGLYFIRIEYSGNKLLDKININFNSNQ